MSAPSHRGRTADSRGVDSWVFDTDFVDVLAVGTYEVLIVTPDLGAVLLDRLTGEQLVGEPIDSDDPFTTPLPGEFKVRVSGRLARVRTSEPRIVSTGDEPPMLFGQTIDVDGWSISNELNGVAATNGIDRLRLHSEHPMFDETELIVDGGWLFAGLSDGHVVATRLDGPSGVRAGLELIGLVPHGARE